MCVPSWPRTEDLCAFLSAAFDNARPKPVDIFLPPLRLPPMVVLFVVSLPLDDAQKAMLCVSRCARLCSGGNVTSRRRFETSLFSPRVRRLLLVNTESGALLFDERRTHGEREKERESFILLSSIARIQSIHSFGKRARRSRPIAFRGNQSNGSNFHIEKSKRLHIHIKSSWRQKSSA